MDPDNAETQEMEIANGEAVEVKGHKLVCPVCGQDRFWSRRSLLNTRGATFFKFDWANKKANNFVCARCGYIFWFWPE